MSKVCNKQFITLGHCEIWRHFTRTLYFHSPSARDNTVATREICNDRFWENPYKCGKYHYSISSVLVISLIFVKIFFIMKMDVWNIVLGPGKDIRSGTHYNSRSKPKTLAGRNSTSEYSIRITGTRP